MSCSTDLVCGYFCDYSLLCVLLLQRLELLIEIKKAAQWPLPTYFSDIFLFYIVFHASGLSEP